MNDVTTMLQDLHDQYAEQVNLAVAEGRDDLVKALSEQFAATATAALQEVVLPAMLDPAPQR